MFAATAPCALLRPAPQALCSALASDAPEEGTARGWRRSCLKALFDCCSSVPSGPALVVLAGGLKAIASVLRRSQGDIEIQARRSSSSETCSPVVVMPTVAHQLPQHGEEERQGGTVEFHGSRFMFCEDA